MRKNAGALKTRKRPPEAPKQTPDAPRPSSSPPRPNSLAATPNKVHAATNDRVQSPPRTSGFKLAIFAEGRKRAFTSRLTPAQGKAALRVDPRLFRHPAAYLLALANVMKPRPPADDGQRVAQKFTR